MGEARKKSFFKGLKGEFKKIVWPDQKTLTRQTVTVIVLSLVIGAFIAGIDLLFSTGIGYIY